MASKFGNAHLEDVELLALAPLMEQPGFATAEIATRNAHAKQARGIAQRQYTRRNRASLPSAFATPKVLSSPAVIAAVTKALEQQATVTELTELRDVLLGD